MPLAQGSSPCVTRVAYWSQYHLRKQVGPVVNVRVACSTHPLTRVVLTSRALDKFAHLRI